MTLTEDHVTEFLEDTATVFQKLSKKSVDCVTAQHCTNSDIDKQRHHAKQDQPDNEDKRSISEIAQTPIRLLDRFPLSFPPQIRYSRRWLQ